MQLSPFDLKCRDLLDDAPQVKSRSCFQNAFNHLELAEKIKGIDPLMAAFRTLTAEEEAASGLMYCLKECGYKNAGILKPKDHAWKNAVIPFLNMLSMFFAEFLGGKGIEAGLHIHDQDGTTRLALMVTVSVDGDEKWAYPIPPLNFGVTSDAKRIAYRRQLNAFLEAKGAKDIITYVKEQANVRNRLLYAGSDGYPNAAQVPDNFYQQRLDRVTTLLRAYLLISPYREIQSFAQDCLDAFLAMLGPLKDHDLHDEL